MFGERDTRNRLKEITTKFVADPVLPMLGWTKAVETIVTSGPLLAWCVYATIVTVLWVYADEIQRQAEQVAEEVEETVTGEDQSELKEYQG